MTTNYLDQLTDEQRAVLLRPMNWTTTVARLERHLAAAKPKYRHDIAAMLRIARAKRQ